ncbi:alpha/beta fold hydrolase [Umezawaea sp. Da 62-37]|uniref:alpha/beta fold hydrolase n=1 Tax=Umezawaea sp. Da 62-37 TaxID=3075927 RepID=UPI0028F6D03C|nr:alpha/beta fold hydrolase [Umezawaea sp. Da 62-37]WNV86242.1 alpha/beta fold hydrolase [Umezawaea sp. Da 62-37]
MDESSAHPDAVVFGATGFIGRWTVLRLLTRGRAVAAVVRGDGRGDELRAWLRDHGAPAERLAVVVGDLTGGADLGLSAADDRRLADVRDVFNTAALYRFGLSRDQARAVNVDGSLHVLRWAATRPGLRRLVHVSGYRVGTGPARYPLPKAEADRLYRDKGAYEGSKVESDAAVRVAAAESGVPLTVVNPSSVIGHSATGETGQYIGLAGLVRDLWTGGLPVLPGTARTFVPVVAVDHFADFLVAIPDHDPEPGGLHWVLDASTPELPDLVRLLAAHLGVRAPRLRVPVALVRSLPAALTGADPETLTFLSEDRYDTTSADEVAAAAGLRQPPVEAALRHWADRLVANGFGTAAPVLPGGFHEVAGSRTYVAGDRAAPDFVLLHGLPHDGESWREVLGELGGPPALVPDLPGLGRSGPTTTTPPDWLTDLMTPVRTRPVLVAHSAAAAPALRYAATHPDRVAALVLVSPYFLQAQTRPPRRALAADTAGRPRRPGVARRAARWYRSADDPAERAALRALLVATRQVPVHIVTGQGDPLTGGTGFAITTTIPAAGHDPHLTHPAAVATVLRRVADAPNPG